MTRSMRAIWRICERWLRARITRTSFTNPYELGDFKGDPRALMQRWFDLHLHLANWGTRRVMMRLPARLFDPARLEPFLQAADWVEVERFGEHVLLDFVQDDTEPGADWDDGTGWLPAIVPLRADLLSGDLRMFYLVWLSAVAEGLLPDETPEPVPGIAPLTGPLDAFATFFGIDADLVAVAAERECDDRLPSGEAARSRVAALSEGEKQVCCCTCSRATPMSRPPCVPGCATTAPKPRRPHARSASCASARRPVQRNAPA